MEGVHVDPSRCRQFLVCGKAGVGKSSLINSLAGREVCQVNDPGLTGGTLGAGTKLNKVTVIIKNERFDIYESPGLQDGTASESEGYLSDMQQKCKDVDLFLYCVDMTSARFGTDDIEALGLITRTFGKHFWSRCLLVMTKANMVALPASVKRKGEERDYHRRLYNNLLSTFRRHLAALDVPNTSYIPACAAGLYYKKEGVPFDNEYRYIWYVSDKCTAKASTDFLDPMWEMCMDVIDGQKQWVFIKYVCNTALSLVRFCTVRLVRFCMVRFNTVRLVHLVIPAVILLGVISFYYLWSYKVQHKSL